MKTYKRLLALLLALTMLLLVGCGEDNTKKKDKDDDDDDDIQVQVDDFADVKEQLLKFYDPDGNVPSVMVSPFGLVTTLKVGEELYSISWSVANVEGEVDNLHIESAAGTTSLVFDGAVEEDVFVTLRATIINTAEKSDSTTLRFKIPGSGVTVLPDGPGQDVVEPNTAFDTSTLVTITFTHTMGARLQEVLNSYIEQFNRIYPNITIIHQSAGGWGDINRQINTEIAGNNPPNIAYCYPDHVAMYNIAKAPVDLQPLINNTDKIAGSGETIGLTSAQKADFIQSFYNEGKVYGDGKMYTLPMSKSTEVLYYNKTVFEQHGWKIPTTWDEMWKLCAEIKKMYPNDIPLGYDSESNWFITMCEQMGSGFTSVEGGGKYLFNNAENKEFVKQLQEYYKKGYFTTAQLYGAYTSGLFTETTDKRSFMCIASSGGASYQASNNDTADGSFAFEVGVAPIPQVNPNNPKTISQGPSLCILKGSRTTDQQIMASWLFVKYLCTNVNFQAEFSITSGYMPVLKSVANHPSYKAWLDRRNGTDYLIAQCVYVGIQNVGSYFVPPAFNGSSTAREQAEDLILYCLGSANADIDDAFEQAIEECE